MTDIIKAEVVSPIQLANEHYETMKLFVQQHLKEGQDYGVIPHTNGKATLLKPGAEKLCKLFNLRPHFQLIEHIADFDKPLFYYHYSCTLYRNGEAVGQGEGNCNSYEKKYRFTRDGQPNPRVFDAVNTICKMAQKRSLIAAVLCSVGASEFFTQDLEDSSDDQTTQAPVIKQKVNRKNGELTREEWLARQGRLN